MTESVCSSSTSRQSTLSDNTSAVAIPWQTITYKVCPCRVVFKVGSYISKKEEIDKEIKWKLGFILEERENFPGFFDILYQQDTHISTTDITCVCIEGTIEMTENKIEIWKEKISEDIKQYCNKNIAELCIGVKQGAMEFARYKLYNTTEDILKNENKILIFAEEDRKLHIVGKMSSFDVFPRSLMDNILEREVVKRDFKLNLNDNIIFSVGNKMTDLQSQCPCICIVYDESVPKLDLEGFEDDVENAWSVLETLFQNYTYKVFQLSERKAQFVRNRKKHVKQFLKRKFKVRNWSWKLLEKDLHVVCPISARIEPDDFIQTLIRETVLTLTPAEAEKVFTSQRWTYISEDLHDNHDAYMDIIVELDKNRITTLCTANVNEQVQKEIEQFRKECAILEMSTRRKETFSFINRFRGKDIDKIQKDNVKELVEITSKGNYFEVHATENGILNVLACLGRVEEKIMTRDIWVTARLDALQFLQSGDVQHVRLEKSQRVILRLNTKTIPELKYEEGKIEDQTTSVIVNSVSPDLQLNVGQPKIATSIYLKGGKSFQMNLLMKYPKGIQFGQMVVTQAVGNLLCDQVFNCCLKGHSSNAQSQDDLYRMVTKCLEQTKTLGPNCKSIAFPALGTGVHGYPAQMAAMTTFRTINQFFLKNKDTQLETVKVVIFPNTNPEVKQSFESEFNKIKEGQGEAIQYDPDDGTLVTGYLTAIYDDESVLDEVIRNLNQSIRQYNSVRKK